VVQRACRPSARRRQSNLASTRSGFEEVLLTEAGLGRTDGERPPICPICGVTMVPAELSEHIDRQRDWVCLECEERGEPEVT
jgi:hypothetical protein